MSNSDIDALAAELGEFAPPGKKKGRPASEERIIAGFEEIQRFTEKHGRAPQHGDGRDIFERLYAVRLDRMRALPDCRSLLEPLDHQGLLAGASTANVSDHPYVAQHCDLIHKVGVTGGRVETRIANAEHDSTCQRRCNTDPQWVSFQPTLTSTYLLAKVKVVATYKLAGINRTRLERLLHKLFAPARLNININDRFGRPVQPEEWFLVPLFVIDEAVARIKDGSIRTSSMILAPRNWCRRPEWKI
uniref:GIY-YIG nuclease family protein n=1 Tax=Castellaniella ginsengisoli TaxID=546114 RepID=UPI003F655043